MNTYLRKFLLFILIFFYNHAFSQQPSGDFFVFKSDWSSAKSIDDCTYFMQKIKKSDSEYVCRYYNKIGPMIKQETYKDDKLSIPNGRFCWYNENGKIDSCGLVNNFKKDGRWDYFFGDSTNPTYYQEYDNGKFLKQSSYTLPDTLKVEKDSTQKEARFANRPTDWIRYLEKNLVIPDRLKSLGRGNYTITVCFLVTKKGNVEDLYLRKSVEWSADATVFEIFAKSPLWKPAIKKGEPVLYRQLQNIILSVN